MSKRWRGQEDPVMAINRLDFTTFCATHVPAYLLPANTAAPETDALHFTLLDSDLSKRGNQALERLSGSDLDSCVTLIEKTSGDDYRSSVIGWSTAKKRRELGDKDMRYIIVRSKGRDESAEAIIDGFAAFMFTFEDGLPVVYVYEIHLESHLRGQGTGVKLMDLMESIGRSVGMEKIMLTVFRSNTTALAWYHRLGFGIDEYSPSDKKLRSGVVKQSEYLILSKALES